MNCIVRFFLKRHLRKLGNNKINPTVPGMGICCEIELKYGTKTLKQVKLLFRQWPEFSGRKVFPVPHPTLGPSVAFLTQNPLWGNDEYGDARRRLCKFIADNL